ncbi:MAG: hypothetical protein A2663_04725 [Candidatus Buchananbacteria bacterium RIFCSPHIGHO2_01_FULL_46_12]|uniref:Uncharacterized protein n=1 Tax=Candidatus Buchananbacteria bacterium RIFCSPHIGHO2_01_FULL_46_12 TaxID=1797536 RepID=A0A1G1YA10_9BACT|nr:MAG: hypothetical protein A2663_04725 [Candidatus Buchananbacteria bacterium RIFCSPHIGHO2_01_FULL_46_12]
MSIINRTDESFSAFLKKYWWIEFLVIVKVLYFVSQDYYQVRFGFMFVFSGFIILWILYRLGLE